MCTYSSVPNRRAVRNKRAGGKIVSKSINVQTKIRPCRGKFFLKINKRADQNRTAVQDKIDVQGGKFSQNHYTCRAKRPCRGNFFSKLINVHARLFGTLEYFITGKS